MNRATKILVAVLIVMLAALLILGVVLVMTADSWGEIANGYFAVLAAIGIAAAVGPAFR